MKCVKIKDFFIGDGHPLVLISGPCVIESEDSALETAGRLKEICAKVGIPLIYKSSYDKANRSSYNSFRGPGIEKGLAILEKVKKTLNLPVLTDVHTPEEATIAAHVCDMIQIPAFLCRQTDLVVAAAATGCPINVKKGQFMAPWDMRNVVDKICSAGNENILLTDRGTSFGYNNLVCDMRAIEIMRECGFPTCFDASHAVQLPGGLGTTSGGDRRYIPCLSKAAVAAGANCLFIESHLNPEVAKSDRETVFPVDRLEALLKQVQQIHLVCSEK